MKAITVRQPWAWAIINAGKDIENRTWNTHFRGRVAIHAAVGMTREEYENGCEYIKSINRRIKIPAYEDLARGAMIGTVEILDCVRGSNSLWFEGEYGFVLARPKKLPEPIPCKGALSFWKVPQNIGSRIKRAI
jgi:ASCH domain